MTTSIETVELQDVRELRGGVRELRVKGKGWVRIRGASMNHLLTKDMRAAMPLTAVMAFHTHPHPVTGQDMVTVRPFDPDRADNRYRAQVGRRTRLEQRFKRERPPPNLNGREEARITPPFNWEDI